jgi:hypothetical protein
MTGRRGKQSSEFRQTVLRTLGASLETTVLAAVSRLTVAGGNEDRQENDASPASRDDPLYLQGPTTRYQQIDEFRPGVFGELENRGERTVWIASLSVEFYAESGEHVGTRTQYFLRIRPGESREVSIPFTSASFEDRSLNLASGLLDVMLEEVN